MQYTILPYPIVKEATWLKLSDDREVNIMNKLLATGRLVNHFVGKGEHALFYKPTVWNYLSIFLDHPPAFDEYKNPIKQPKVKHILFDDSIERDAVFVLALGKVASMWWSATANGFDLTKGNITSMPIPANSEFLLTVSRLAPHFKEALNETIGYRKNAGAFYGNYDVRKIRHLTDQIDRLILEQLDLEDHWNTLQLFYAKFTKQSTDRTVLLEKPNFNM